MWGFLLLLAAGMVFIALPYQVMQGQFKPSYIFGLGFWAFVGITAYTRVFHPAIAEAEARERKEQKERERGPRQKAKRIGWIFGLVSLPVLAGVMFGQGAEVGVVAFMGALGALVVGLLSWGIAGVLINASSK